MKPFGPPSSFLPSGITVTPPGTTVGPITAPGVPQGPYVSPPKMNWPFDVTVEPPPRPTYVAALAQANWNAWQAKQNAQLVNARLAVLQGMMRGDAAQPPDSQPPNIGTLQNKELIAVMYLQEMYQVGGAIANWQLNAVQREGLGLKTLPVPEVPDPPDLSV